MWGRCSTDPPAKREPSVNTEVRDHWDTETIRVSLTLRGSRTAGRLAELSALQRRKRDTSRKALLTRTIRSGSASS